MQLEVLLKVLIQAVVQAELAAGGTIKEAPALQGLEQVVVLVATQAMGAMALVLGQANLIVPISVVVLVLVVAAVAVRIIMARAPALAAAAA